MGDIRAKFSLPIDEDFILADYPTLDHMMGYIVKMQGGEVALNQRVEATVLCHQFHSTCRRFTTAESSPSQHLLQVQVLRKYSLQWLASS